MEEQKIEYKRNLLEDIVNGRKKFRIEEKLELVDYAIDLASQEGGYIGKCYLYKMFSDYYSWLPGSAKCFGGSHPWHVRTSGVIFGFAMGNWGQNFPRYLQAGLKIARALNLEEELKTSIGQMRSGSKFLEEYEVAQGENEVEGGE